MDAASLREASVRAGMARVNDRIASATYNGGGTDATFVCECGKCGGDFVSLSLEEFDQLRAREEPVLATEH